MATPITPIIQIISTVPALRHRSTVNPTSQADKDDFVIKYEANNDHLANNTVSELNTLKGQLNTTIGQINTVSGEVATNASQAQDARDEAVAAVATLPEGIISDGTTSAIDTWSSNKISSELSSKLSLSGGTMTGAITALKETSVAIGDSDIDMSLGNLFTKTITGATTLTVSNVPTSETVGYFILKLTNGGAGAVTYPTGTKWSKGTAPTLTASGVDLLRFITIDGGTRWEASKIQEDSK